MQITSVRDLSIQVKERRKELGWTQAQLAENAGVSRDWIMALERAKPSVELSLVLRTLKALHTQLFTDEPQVTLEGSSSTQSSTEAAMEVIRRHRKRTDHGNA